jgi:hypothetical protein
MSRLNTKQGIGIISSSSGSGSGSSLGLELLDFGNYG